MALIKSLNPQRGSRREMMNLELGIMGNAVMFLIFRSLFGRSFVMKMIHYYLINIGHVKYVLNIIM